MDLLTRTYIWTVLDAPLRFLFTKQIVPLLPSMPNLPSYQLVPSSSAENVLDVTSRQQEGSAAYLSVVVRGSSRGFHAHSASEQRASRRLPLF